jgi:hypothetical protein
MSGTKEKTLVFTGTLGMTSNEAAPPPAAPTPSPAKLAVKTATEAEVVAPKEAPKRATKHGKDEEGEDEDEALKEDAPLPKAAKKDDATTATSASGGREVFRIVQDKATASGRSVTHPAGDPNRPEEAVDELTDMKGELNALKAELTGVKAQLATMHFVAYAFGSVPEGYETFADILREMETGDLKADIRKIQDDIRKIQDDIRSLTVRIERKEEDIRKEGDIRKEKAGEKGGNIRRAQNSPSAMSIIMEAAKARASEEAATDWLLSYPLMQEGNLPDPANLATLQASFKKGEDAVRETLNSAKIGDGALIVSLQAGMGIGKSYAIDIADKLLFCGSEPIVLKVTYNRQPELSAEQESPKHASTGFIARLMLFVLKVGATGMDRIVREVLKADPESKELTSESFVEWFCTQFSNSRPLIIAVDEIGMLSKGSQTENGTNDPPVQEVLSTLAEIIREFKTHPTRPRQAIGFVTALPHLNINSLSSRTVCALDAVAFTEEESNDFLRNNLTEAHAKKTSEPFKSVVYEMRLFCGLHPRSLAVAAKKYNCLREIPTPAAVARDCKWKPWAGLSQGLFEANIRDAVVENHRNGNFSLGEKQKLLLRRASLMKGPNGAWMIPPTFFWSDVDDRNLGNADLPLYHIREIFRFDTSEVPTKALERIHYHWNCFRSVNNLPLIPAAMIVGPVDPELTRLVFPRWVFVSEVDVLGKDRTCSIEKINENTYYRPKSQNHRAIESMCVARASDSIAYLCLFQCKIDADLTRAIESLKEAAEDLKVIWGGKFLLIAFALGASGSSTFPAGDHPTLVVDGDSIDKYFTPTIGTAVRLQMTRHGRAGAK